ncbi:hypothetical protein BGW80DRAFT_1459502 [Lactifluus volemus]|nr:hypothetical protein BGW80DRAFT_1459502 [Lactifluus volemus]
MANYDANYNPNADPAFDNAAFTGDDNAEHHASDVDGTDTSLETMLGKTVMLPRLIHMNDLRNVIEVDTLTSDLRDDEKNIGGGTRGIKVDFYRQEREVDRAVDLASQGDDA